LVLPLASVPHFFSCPPAFAVSFPTHVLSRCGRPYPPSVVYVVKARLCEKCDVVISLAILHEAAYRYIGTDWGKGWWNTRIESPLRKRWWVCGNIYPKTLRTGFIRRRMILWISAARPRRSSGCDPPPACVASRFAPIGAMEPRVPYG
jgi:hypothetical protein